MWRTRPASRSTQVVVRVLPSSVVPVRKVCSPVFRRKFVNNRALGVQTSAEGRTTNCLIPVHLNCATHFVHRLLRFRLSAARAFLDYRDHVSGPLAKLAAALGDSAVAL